MSNKYQEALDYLYDCCEYGLKVTGKVDGEKETLQELINKYMNGLFTYDEITNKANELEKENELLYRELDKLYEILSHNGIRIDGKIEYKSKENWKRWIEQLFCKKQSINMESQSKQ